MLSIIMDIKRDLGTIDNIPLLSFISKYQNKKFSELIIKNAIIDNIDWNLFFSSLKNIRTFRFIKCDINNNFHIPNIINIHIFIEESKLCALEIYDCDNIMLKITKSHFREEVDLYGGKGWVFLKLYDSTFLEDVSIYIPKVRSLGIVNSTFYKNLTIDTEIDEPTIIKSIVKGNLKLNLILKKMYLSLEDNKIEGNLILEDMQVDEPISGANTIIKGNLIFNRSKINNELFFHNAKINGHVDFRFSKMSKTAILKGFKIENMKLLNADFSEADFRGVLCDNYPKILDENDYKKGHGKIEDWEELSRTYWNLKEAYRNAHNKEAMHEYEYKSKYTQFGYLYPFNKKFLKNIVPFIKKGGWKDYLWGWGYRPWNPTIFSIILILLFFIYFPIKGIIIELPNNTHTILWGGKSNLIYTIGESFYFSLSNFIGFGVSYMRVQPYWPQLFVIFEVLIGKILIALSFLSWGKRLSY